MLKTDEFEVMNAGVAGRTMLKSGDAPIWKEPVFKKALKWKPDIVLIMLGSNDSKFYQWHMPSFIADYSDMIKTWKDIESKPRIVIMPPIPLYQRDIYGMSSEVVNDVLPELMK